MPRLEDGRLLSNDITDFVLRGITLSDLPRKRIYLTHFYSKLMRESDIKEGTRYTFMEVHTWARCIHGSIQNLEELYIPVNKNRNHWMVVRVNFPRKRVEAWDLLVPATDTQRCLANILRYVYDALTHTGTNPPCSRNGPQSGPASTNR